MKVCVRVPASIANMGPGFDAFAVALKEPHEFVRITATDSDKLSLEIVPKGLYKIPSNPEENTAGVSALSYLRKHGIKGHFTIEIEKLIKPCGGIGSSAASAVGALRALNSLYGRNTLEELIAYASEGEVVSSGAVHHDNTSASMLGGFVINDGHNFSRYEIREIPIVIAVPDIDLKTSESRSALGSSVSIHDLKSHISSSALLLDSIFRDDLRSIGKYVNIENVVERRRSGLITGYQDVKKAAVSAGAYGVSISGSGPSVFAITSKDTGTDVASVMRDAFSENGVTAKTIITNSSNSGAEVIG